MAQYLKRREETVFIDVPSDTQAGSAALVKMNRFSPSYDTVKAFQIIVENLTDSSTETLSADVSVETGVGTIFSSNRPLSGVTKHAAEPYWILDTENKSDYTFRLNVLKTTKKAFRVYITAFLEITK